MKARAMMLHEAQKRTRPEAMPRMGSMARKPVKRITSAETMMIRLPTPDRWPGMWFSQRSGKNVAVSAAAASQPARFVAWVSTQVHTRMMHAQLLSNGRYRVLLTDAGAGFSRWRNLAVTRWREDPIRDSFGTYLFLRDVDSGAVWSAGTQPCGVAADEYAATLSDAGARIVRRDGTLTTTLEVAVAPDVDAEVRLVTLANDGASTRTIELTSYAELVLGPAAADASHPAFSKLFVQTECVIDGVGRPLLLARRRRRDPDEPSAWAAHFAVSESTGAFGFETDRARFVGRSRALRQAVAMRRDAALSNTTGTVLDPIFSARCRLGIAPGANVSVAFVTMAAESREAAIALAAPLRTLEACEGVIGAAAEHAQEEHARLGIDADDAERYGRMTAPLLYADSDWRAPAEILERGSGGAPVLWAAGISGDRPVVLMRIAVGSGLDRMRDLLQAQRYWRSKGLDIDVVLLTTADSSAAARDSLLAAQREQSDGEGGVFLLNDSQISDALRVGLATAARIVIDAGDGKLQSPGERTIVRDLPPAPPVAASASPTPVPSVHTAKANHSEPLEFFNGVGGFAQQREYAIELDGERCTPAPWINVVANPAFGSLVSAEGGGYTWSINSQQNPLTPWPNDPVSDRPHEVIYLRDEDSGEFWSATAAPARVSGAAYAVRHGKGYSRFTHKAHGIDVELLLYVPVADSIKLSRLQLRNCSGRPRRLSVTAYVEWALGANGTVPAPFVVTSIDTHTGALFARNAWRAEFGERIAFIDLGGLQTSCTGDRGEFIGRDGDVDRPAALTASAPLSGRVGAGIDPCGALQTQIELAADAKIEIVSCLGDAESHAHAQALVEKYRAADLDAVLDEVATHWNEVLDTVQVRTPDRALDIMLNDWLLYQTLACRVWARSAYYQSSGAYGFRDQLQDVAALCIARPDIAREHLLRSASRQFVEGDVQHWWLPPAGQGVRTRMTDDRVWLPNVAARYIEVTGDVALLDAPVSFIDGPPLKDQQHESFFLPTTSPESASFYEHCARAIDVSMALGPHGLPLIGTGDWNDGMNRVGVDGRGESVWLAWFLIATIDAFVPHARARRDHPRVARWQEFAATVRATLEGAGWDGRWYRRGYYDDGTPLGSGESSECKIDAIAQSWSVIAGATDQQHAAQAMASVDEHLIHDDDKLALLFTPPFDRTPLDPGYIKAYPPGIRENGGQYTHGAIWSVFAFAKLGEGDRAASLFNLLNPIAHSSTPDAVVRYKVEPYAACADVYSVAPHVGGGGWTWYTGSAAWLYRAGLEAILGFHLQGDALVIDPCLPKSWSGYEIVFRYRGARNITRYEIVVENPYHVSRGVIQVELDGRQLSERAPIRLADDGGVHQIRLVLGDATWRTRGARNSRR